MVTSIGDLAGILLACDRVLRRLRSDSPAELLERLSELADDEKKLGGFHADLETLQRNANAIRKIPVVIRAREPAPVQVSPGERSEKID